MMSEEAFVPFSKDGMVVMVNNARVPSGRAYPLAGYLLVTTVQ